MADVVIDTDIAISGGRCWNGPAVVFTSTTVGYLVFKDSDSDLKYYKTTDGGQTWSGPTTIRTGTVIVFSIWFDKWTPGDSGTKIHTWYLDGASIFYRALDTSDDSLGSEVTVFTGTSGTQTDSEPISGAKARGGNLYVAFTIDDGTEDGCYRSTDGGANWTSRATPIEDQRDFVLMFPGNEADNQDMWLAFWDISANEISLKTYDDSLDSWSEQSIATSMNDASKSNIATQMTGVIRHSDNHLILAAWNDRDLSTADLRCWDINGAASITEKTNVNTNTDDCQGAALFIDQNNDDLYCAYIGKSDGSETVGTSVGVYYKKSTDDATTWGSETTIAETLGAWAAVVSGFGGTTSRFLVAWNPIAVGADLITNYVNSVSIGGAAAATPRFLAMMGVGT